MTNYEAELLGEKWAKRNLGDREQKHALIALAVRMTPVQVAIFCREVFQHLTPNLAHAALTVICHYLPGSVETEHDDREAIQPGDSHYYREGIDR